MLSETQNLKRNFKLLYCLNFFLNSAFTLPIYILFGREYLGLSYLQAGSFLLVSWFVSIVLDFFGGVFTDKIGRKKAFVYGMVIQIATFIPFLLTKSYPLLIISSVLNGIGVALSSNSIDALIYEQAIVVGKKNDYQHANAISQVFVFLGRIYATILGGLSYKIDPRLPYLLYIVALCLVLITGLVMKTDNIVKRSENGKYLNLVSTAFKVYKNNLALLKFVIVSGIFAFWADMLFAYYQPFFIEQGVTSTTLGFLFATISIGSAAGSFMMRKLPDKLSALIRYN